MVAVIENHRISGTRITVWDVLHYLEHDWTITEIAEALQISAEQVQAAQQYIAENRDEVMAIHRQIEERNARGNPPAIESRRNETRKRVQEWRKKHRTEQESHANGTRPSGGR